MYVSFWVSESTKHDELIFTMKILRMELCLVSYSQHLLTLASFSLSLFFFLAFVIIHGSKTNQTVRPSTHLLINKPIHPPIHHLLNT